ncbi:MAG: hypothetical protein ACI845_001947 [Gammaproteobacteria bacterium]|jgi:uncharacterized protein (TIGR00369 family)
MKQIDVTRFNEIVQEGLPVAADAGIHLKCFDGEFAEVVMPYHENTLRPGGTISGPHMMLIADVCMFAVVLGAIGEVKLAVTTNLNINFLRKPGASDLVARGKALKMGKRLAVIDVSIFSDGDLVAHATGTYSIPPR